MRILGIDPGLDRTGWALVSKNRPGLPLLESCGLLHTDSGLELQERLENIFTSLRSVIEKEKPDCLAIEEIFFMKAAYSVAATIQARGVILLAAQLSGCRIKTYNPRTVKMTLTGNGNAAKAQMQRMAQLLLKLKTVPKPDDIADAIAIALCHMRKAELLVKISSAKGTGNGRG